MLTRRRFNRALGATLLAGAARSRPARAAPIKLRVANAAGIIDPQLVFHTVGEHPKLGYYREEGVEFEYVNLSSSSQAIQALATGSADYGTMSPASYLPIVAKNPALNIVSCYVWLRQNQTLVGVKPDSPYQSIADLKGKRIGIRNQGDTGYFGTMAMLKELGLDPAKDVEWPAVGGGGPAGQALYSGQIDAIAIWDAELARVEIAGFKLRYLPNTPGARKLFGSADGVNRTLLKEHPDWLARHFRAQAKSTIFAHANPELAVRLHWQLYPESKPKGKGEEEALKDALYILKMRMDKWFAAPWQDDKRMGASTPEEWSAWIAFTGTEDRIKDPAALFTNELIDEINAFDRGAVLEQARTLRL